MELSLRLPSEIAREDIRPFILRMEHAIMNHPQSKNGAELKSFIQVKHRFSDGQYLRECPIPKGQVVIGMIHRHDHPVFLLKGSARVLTETGGIEELVAPYYGISPAGTKRFLMTHEDTVWVTTHANPDNCRDIDVLEKRLVAETYGQLAEAV
jgi:hypothetical protein